jgi:AraC-like DNA-binding protein
MVDDRLISEEHLAVSGKRMPVRYFVLLRDALAAQGVDTARLLQMADIDAEQFQQPDASLLPAQLNAFIVAGRQLTGRSDLAFELGRLIKLNSHDILGYGLLSCHNIDQVLRLASRFYHLITEMFTLRYRRGSHFGEAVYSPVIAMPREMLHFYMELVAVAHQTHMQWLLGPLITEYDIWLSMPAPSHHKRYLGLTPARIHFDEHRPPTVTAVMSHDLLDRALAMSAPQVVKQVEAHCETLQRRSVPDSGWGEFIAMMLRQTQGQLTLEDIAQQLNVSARTIDRNLKREKLQFRTLSQQIRFERACTFLGERSATVSKVAQRLGFSDAANFSRAFRRYAGISPGQYQQQCTDVRGASAD